jgi:hypothetical protein
LHGRFCVRQGALMDFFAIAGLVCRSLARIVAIFYLPLFQTSGEVDGRD